MKHLIQFFTFLAFLTQIMIPAGFMPQARADGMGRMIVICSGFDQKTIDADQDGQPANHKSTKKPCLYAGVLSADPPVLSGIMPPVVTLMAMAGIFPEEQNHPGYLSALPHATGPPVVL